jgi:hypothetical protein
MVLGASRIFIVSRILNLETKMPDKKFLNTQEAATHFGVPVGTLIKARIKGNGPKFTKLGDSRNAPLLYRPDDIQDWLDQNTHNSIAEAMGRSKNG